MVQGQISSRPDSIDELGQLDSLAYDLRPSRLSEDYGDGLDVKLSYPGSLAVVDGYIRLEARVAADRDGADCSVECWPSPALDCRVEEG